MKSLIPKSKAKTAYGLLSEVAALVRAEPKRLAMAIWTTDGDEDLPPTGVFPACGTVGCIGGWTETLMRERGIEYPDAPTILGLVGEQSALLFCPSRLMNAANQQTPEHAAETVAHIHKFQKRYRAQLLAKKV